MAASTTSCRCQVPGTPRCMGLAMSAISTSRVSALAAGANVLHGATDAWSVFGFVDHANPWGLGRFQANYATDDQQNSTQLTFDQSWKVPAGMNLSTSLILGRENFGNASGSNVGVAVYGGMPDTEQSQAGCECALGQRIRRPAFRECTGEYRTQLGIRGRLGREPQLLREPQHWSSAVHGYLARFQRFTPVVQTFNDRSVFFSVRYDWRAGSRSRHRLGGAAGADPEACGASCSSTRTTTAGWTPGRPRAPNVIVLLDGRFTVRTDYRRPLRVSRGRPGNHVVTVLPDNLPLPWVVSSSGRFDVQVRVRDQTRIEIPAQRLR